MADLGNAHFANFTFLALFFGIFSQGIIMLNTYSICSTTSILSDRTVLTFPQHKSLVGSPHLSHDLPRNDDDLEGLKRYKAGHTIHDSPPGAPCFSGCQMQDDGDAGNQANPAKNGGDHDSPPPRRAGVALEVEAGGIVFAADRAICSTWRRSEIDLANKILSQHSLTGIRRNPCLSGR